MKVKSDHRSKFSNFKQLERRSLKKNQGFNGIQTRDLRDTSEMLYQLSYEATHWSPDFFFQASSFQLLKIGKFTAMITLHFHLQPQYNMNYFL